MGIRKRKNPIKILPERQRATGAQGKARSDAGWMPGLGASVGGALGGLGGGILGSMAGPAGAGLGMMAGAGIGASVGSGIGQSVAGLSQEEYWQQQGRLDDDYMIAAMRADRDLEQWARQKAIDLSTLELVAAQGPRVRQPGFKWSGADIGRG